MQIEKGKYWDKAWSLIDGCSAISEACDNCWLKEMNNRFRPDKAFQEIEIREDRLDIPSKIKKPTVFAIWSDLFHGKVPIEFQCHALAKMRYCKWHTFLVLTKRHENLQRLWTSDGYFNKGESLPNVFFGVTVENQEMADKRIPELIKVPSNKFLSVEPMIGEIVIPKLQLSAIHQVICGGETGKNRRPMNLDWVRSLRDQCEDAEVPFFYKQDGKGNRILDGRTHDNLIWGHKCN